MNNFVKHINSLTFAAHKGFQCPQKNILKAKNTILSAALGWQTFTEGILLNIVFKEVPLKALGHPQCTLSVMRIFSMSSIILFGCAEAGVASLNKWNEASFYTN